MIHGDTRPTVSKETRDQVVLISEEVADSGNHDIGRGRTAVVIIWSRARQGVVFAGMGGRSAFWV